MDWSKAKNILLVLFIVLNCILLYNNYVSFSGGGSILSDEMSSNTLAVLTSRGISLNCEIPHSAKAATVIYGPYFEDRQKISDVLLGPNERDNMEDGKEIREGTKHLKFDNNYFYFKDKSPGKEKKIDGMEQAKQLLEDVFDKMGVPYKDFKLDRENELEGNIYRIEYKQVYEDYIFYNNYIKAEIGATGILSLEFKYKNVRGVKMNVKQKTIDAYQVLLKMTDVKNVNINDIDIGYGNYSDGGIGFTDVLSWRVKLSDESEKFYSAFTGQKLKPD
ncbi:hypothetical protein [Pseudobacteroides cellulosolvens]|uniref:Regulatory protein YycH-like domain-containing protein n=1 Tax=Pseudobacteroides cellulosolvens ATCC 35603 = DSM 2933 TaxID=398512 RepID=A0A0L6JUX7_9FIRM|nr:hypothetical protein [Pseudobacteroides cellulosolvens]KNY29633.1 hypothetical protein Bccel_4907 [Pseudobacteroides cellulosolvens ATCC 35603 = DSM 2933]